MRNDVKCRKLAIMCCGIKSSAILMYRLLDVINGTSSRRDISLKICGIIGAGVALV